MKLERDAVLILIAAGLIFLAPEVFTVLEGAGLLAVL